MGIKYLVIRTLKRYQDGYTYEACIEVIGDTHDDLHDAHMAKITAENFYPTGERFAVIQIWE